MGREDRFDFDLARARLGEFFAAAREDGSPRARLEQFWRLVDDGTPEQQIRTWRRVRDAGLLPPSAAAVLIAYHVHAMAESRCEELPEMVALYACVENDLDPPGDDPADPRRWMDARSRRIDEMNRAEMRMAAAIYREFGEDKIATLATERPDDFHKLMAAGRAYFYPPPPPSYYEECAGGGE